MTEFVVVGPIITLIGLAILQYSLLFFAKNQINHASFMAARAGSVANANLEKVNTAFFKALVPLYGGGQSQGEIAESLGRAQADLAGNVRIELINPTKESFDDYADPELQALLRTGTKRVIPNNHLAFRTSEIRSGSGQTIQDANLIKLRITHGYRLSVPIVSQIYKVFLKWLDPGTDPFYSQLVSAGRIPVVSHVTMQMQSNPIEDRTISVPGSGNGGSPVDPGPKAPGSKEPGPAPECINISCRPPSNYTPPGPPVTDPPLDPGGPCTGPDCPVCPAPTG